MSALELPSSVSSLGGSDLRQRSSQDGGTLPLLVSSSGGCRERQPGCLLTRCLQYLPRSTNLSVTW